MWGLLVAIIVAFLSLSSVYGASISGLNHSSSSIENLLVSLPPALLSSPTFVYRSQSLQGASLASPRTLLSDESGELVLAFNGDPAHAGFNQVEAMQFDPAGRRFVLYEISVSNSGTVAVSDPNPAKCLTCHRGDPRPNWESYDQWPGVYGSKDDALSEDEFLPFKNFLTGMATRPRYGALKVNHLKSVLTRTSHYGRLPQEPNISFTHRLSQNNFKRVARLISQTPDYARFKFMVAGFLAGTDGERFATGAYFPEGLGGVEKYYSAAHIKEAQANATAITVNADVASALTFRSLFESRGVETADWFLNFQGGLTNTFLNGVSWEGQLLEALLEVDPSLRSFLLPDSTYQLDENRLQEASRGQFAIGESLELLAYETDPAAPRRIWNTSCRQCHEVKEMTQVPQLTYEAAVAKPKFSALVKSGAMPPNQKLTPSEKAHLYSASTK